MKNVHIWYIKGITMEKENNWPELHYQDLPTSHLDNFFFLFFKNILATIHFNTDDVLCKFSTALSI